jgi:glyoxylase-like metal-dependent hydrolase (beta-lactamase superfamily II)
MTMAYTGEVTRGGGAAERAVGPMTMRKVSVGTMDNNAYVLTCGPAQLLIDAANDAPTLLSLVGPTGLETVITTHRHGDHWQALADVVAATGAESLAHADDATGIPVVTRTLQDGDRVTIGDCELEVIHLVGHTPGSIALLYQEPDGIAHLWTGDSLFPGGVGNTHKNKADFESLIADVEQKIFARLPDDTWFYPGHGKDSTLGAERSHLPEWRARGW